MIDPEMIARLRQQRRQIDAESRRRQLKEAVGQLLDEQLGLFAPVPPSADVLPFARREPQASPPVAPVVLAAPAPPEQLPWRTANPRIIKPFGLRLPETMHEQLRWVAARTPGVSMHDIAIAALQRQLDELVRALGVEP